MAWAVREQMEVLDYPPYQNLAFLVGRETPKERLWEFEPLARFATKAEAQAWILGYEFRLHEV